MGNTVEEAVVRKSIRVHVPIERAFSVFVEQMEVWWPPAHHIGAKPFQSIYVEPRVGGRWFERDAEGKECDWGTVRALPSIIRAYRGGDDHLLSGVARIFEGLGFHVVGAHEVAPEILMRQGPLTTLKPAAGDESDIRRALALLTAIGPFDVGQAVVVAKGHVLAVEAAEPDELALPPSAIDPATPDTALATRRDLERLRTAITALPPHFRDVLVLVELAERSYAEVAAICGCELNTVRSRLYRARGLLARALDLGNGARDSNTDAERRSAKGRP